MHRQHHPECRSVAGPPCRQIGDPFGTLDPIVHELVHGLANLSAKDQLGQGDDEGQSQPNFRNAMEFWGFGAGHTNKRPQWTSRQGLVRRASAYPSQSPSGLGDDQASTHLYSWETP